MNKAVIVALLLCVTTFTGCIGGDETSSTDNQLDPVSNLDEEELSQRFANLTASYENLAQTEPLKTILSPGTRSRINRSSNLPIIFLVVISLTPEVLWSGINDKFP